MFPFQYVSLFVCLALCPTACVYVSLSACHCFFLFAILAVCLPVCLNGCMSASLLCCLCICISAPVSKIHNVTSTSPSIASVRPCSSHRVWICTRSFHMNYFVRIENLIPCPLRE